jgi:hypothetical protein
MVNASLLKLPNSFFFFFNIIIVILTKYYSDDQIKKNEMDGACSAYGGEEVLSVFWWGNLRERDHLEDLGLDGKII